MSLVFGGASMATDVKKMQLSSLEISQFIEEFSLHMRKLQIERKNALKFSLSTEQILLQWQEHFGCDATVTITIRKRFGTLSMSIALEGEKYNPLTADSDEQEFSTQLLNNLGLAPIYNYKRGINYIIFKLSRQKDNSVLILLISFVAAVLLGILGLKFFASLASDIMTQFLVPVRTTIMNTLTAVAVPLVFFSVLQGIVGIGDVNSFGKIGKRLMGRFVLKTAAFTAVAGLLLLPVFSLDLFGDGEITSFSGTLQIILDIFPENFIAPFLDGNALQAIVIAVVLGFAVLILDSRADGIKKAGNQLSSALYMIMKWVDKLIPALVFILLLETIWSGNIRSLLGLWKPLLVIAVASIVMILTELFVVAIKYKVSPTRLMKKLLPSTLIAFSTSCAMASYSVTSETCEKDLGINKKVTNFGLPIGFVAYMPAVSVYYLIILFYGLEQYGMSCSIEWLLIAWLTATLLSIATPPVSGGSMACFAVLLSQMSVPAGTIAYALAMNVIAERFCAAADLSMLELELIMTSDKTNYLDRDKLRNKNK